MKLLLSARDPAAAHAVKKLAEMAMSDGRFSVKVVATAPASGMLSELNCELVNLTKESSNFESLQGAACELLANYQPDAVVAGASGPDAGVDELLVRYVRDAKSYVVQDFWGDVNLTLNAPADCYLVVDEFAAELTRKRVNSEAYVTGSVKHVEYENFDVPALRLKGRGALSIDSDSPVYGYFGMPLGDFSGYWRSLVKLSEVIRELPVRLVYRPHPKEDEQTRARTVDILSKCRNFCLDEGLQIEETLASCDVILSCYSSCGIDSELLGRNLTLDSRLSVFLLFDGEIYQFFKDYTQLSDMPLSLQGRSLTIRSEDDLGRVLTECQDPSSRLGYLTPAAEFPAVSESVGKALNKIYYDFQQSSANAGAL